VALALFLALPGRSSAAGYPHSGAVRRPSQPASAENGKHNTHPLQRIGVAASHRTMRDTHLLGSNPR
jgi:hypothetical protein